MGDSSKSKRVETREFWEVAIRLWNDSGLSVREFCRREGLVEHTFYSWRRRQRKQVAGSGKSEKNADKSEAGVADSFIELVSLPASDGVCQCTLELENTGGEKMRVQLRSVTMPDLAAISRSFWDPA